MQKKTKVIAFANNKGGSGKSTTCSNVGYALTLEGYRVLLVDADMQQNLSLSFFAEDDVLAFSESGENLFTALQKECDAREFIRKTKYENLDLLPSGVLMSGAEYELYGKNEKELVLANVLAGAKESGEYDLTVRAELLKDALPFEIASTILKPISWILSKNYKGKYIPPENQK